MLLGLGKKRIMYAAVIWLVFLLSFYANFFGVGLNKEWFAYFQEDSSLISEKTATCKNELSYDGPVIANDNKRYMDIMSSQSCNEENLKPYDSQFGLQARIISFFAPENNDDLSRYFKTIELLLAGLTALLFTFIVIWANSKFGIVPAVASLGFLALSPWVAGYAKNLYWMEPLMFAPFVFGLLLYPFLRYKNNLWLFYLIIGLLLMTKLLNGYEHISTLMASAFIPVVFYEMYDKKRKLLSLWKEASLIVLVGAVAFGASLMLNIAGLSGYYGSWEKASHQVSIRSTARSASGLKATQPDVVINFKSTLPEAYMFIDRFFDLDVLVDGSGHPVKYALISIANYLLLPAVSLPFVLNGMFGVLVQSILAFAVVGYFCIRRLRSISRFKKYYRSFYWSFWLSLLGAISWLVLMPAHAYPHAHLNAIIFYMPFLILCYIAIGIVIQDYAVRKTANRRNN